MSSRKCEEGRGIHTDYYPLTTVDLDIDLFVSEFITESYL